MAKNIPEDFPADYEEKIRDIIRRDPRYACEAYIFVFAALEYTQRMAARARKPEGPVFHVTGRELLEGIRRYAIKHFGLMARTVFETWGIRQTDDFGEIVFSLVDAGLMRKTDTDTREDFRKVYDFAEAFEGETEDRKSWRPAD
jgi:uncharacterized repeat protein (TIGR04138 family)